MTLHPHVLIWCVLTAIACVVVRSTKDNDFILKNYEFVHSFRDDRVHVGLSQRSLNAHDPLPLRVPEPKNFKLLHRRHLSAMNPETWTDTAFDWREEVMFPEVHHQLKNECFAEAAAATLTALWQQLYDKEEFFKPETLVTCAGDTPGQTALPEDVYRIKQALSPKYDCHVDEGDEESMRLAEPFVLCDLWSAVNIEKELMHMLRAAPVAVGLPSTNPAFLNYKSGILKPKHVNTASGIPDHAVALVGFGEENGVPYWTVRNSWGKDWGELGYARIERRDDGSGVLGSYASVTTAI